MHLLAKIVLYLSKCTEKQLLKLVFSARWTKKPCSTPRTEHVFSYLRLYQTSSIVHPVFCPTHKGEVVYVNPMKVSAGTATLIHKMDSMRNWTVTNCRCRFIPRERASGSGWIDGWIKSRAGLKALGTRKYPVHTGNRNEILYSSPYFSPYTT